MTETYTLEHAEHAATRMNLMIQRVNNLEAQIRNVIPKTQ